VICPKNLPLKIEITDLNVRFTQEKIRFSKTELESIFQQGFEQFVFVVGRLYE